VGLRAVLDVVKRKIPSPHGQFNYKSVAILGASRRNLNAQCVKTYILANVKHF